VRGSRLRKRGFEASLVKNSRGRLRRAQDVRGRRWRGVATSHIPVKRPPRVILTLFQHNTAFSLSLSWALCAVQTDGQGGSHPEHFLEYSRTFSSRSPPYSLAFRRIYCIDTTGAFPRSNPSSKGSVSSLRSARGTRPELRIDQSRGIATFLFAVFPVRKATSGQKLSLSSVDTSLFVHVVSGVQLSSKSTALWVIWPTHPRL
jgi:hypothetical protein